MNGEANDSSAPVRTGRWKPRRARQERTLKLRSTSSIETWLIEKFDRMPLWVRVVTYLALVLVLVHGQLRATVIQGDLLIQDQGKQFPAANYSVTAGDSSFRVNSVGKWAVTTSRIIPGTLTAQIGDSNGETLGWAEVPLPIPVWSGLQPSRVLIVYDSQTKHVETKTISLRKWIDPPVWAATSPSINARQLYITLKRLSVRQVDDDDDDIGQIYFFLYVNKQQFVPLGVPSLKYRNTHLAMQRNSTRELQSMTFVAPKIGESFQRVEFGVRVYDYDSCFFCSNPNDSDELGALKTYITPADLNREIKLDPIASRNKIPAGNVSMWIVAEVR